MTAFGSLLREFRVAASLTQEALAERCRVSPATIAALEQGRRRAPRLSTVALIADSLGLSAADRARLAQAAQHGGSAAGALAPAEGVRGDGGAGQPGSITSGHGIAGRGVLPRPITPLIGRFAEAAVIGEHLASERLVCLVGPGGVGKTRLALQVAAASEDKFDAGTWWVELDAVTDPRSVPSAVLASVGGSENAAAPIAQQILNTLPEGRALLVIDNCEHVLDAAAGLIAALLTSPSVVVLATSREPLAIPGELHWPVGPLGLPDPGQAQDPGSMMDVASVQLFVDRAWRARPGFTLTGDTADAVARICRRLDGIPLAIELAAARIRWSTPAQLADDLDRHLLMHGTAARGVPERQATMTASIDWGYRLLDDDERALLRGLAVFSGTFTAPAVHAITTPAGAADIFATTRALAGLVSKSLLSITTLTRSSDEADIPRYRLLESIRAYLTDRATQAGELDGYRDAHAAYYESWLCGVHDGDTDDRTAALIDLDYANVRTALSWSVDQGSAKAAVLVAAVGSAWHLLGRLQDASVLGDAALSIVVATDRRAWVRAAAAMALARLLAGDDEFVSGVLPAVAAEAAELGEARAEAWVRYVLGSLPPYDNAQLEAAYDLGVGAGSLTPAASAAAAASVGGAGDPATDWLARIDELTPRIGSSSVLATCDIARADALIERGDLRRAAEVALSWPTRPNVMPAVRSIANGRLASVALLRRDQDLAASAQAIEEEIARRWPARSFYGIGLPELRFALLRGEVPAMVTAEDARSSRLTLSPVALRTLCRTALDRGERLDPRRLARQQHPPAAGSLMAASIAAIDGAHAACDGNHAQAAEHWAVVLAAAVQHDYLLLACDAVEALAALAGRQGRLAEGSDLLAGAQNMREITGYRFRFAFEQAAVDELRASTTPTGRHDNAGIPPAHDWKATTALALRVARVVMDPGPGYP